MICQESDDAICGDPGGWESPCVDTRLERDPNLRELGGAEFTSKRLFLSVGLTSGDDGFDS